MKDGGGKKKTSGNTEHDFDGGGRHGFYVHWEKSQMTAAEI